MPKTPKLGKTPTKDPLPAPTPAPEIEQPKYTAAHLTVAKAEAFDSEMRFQVANAERQQAISRVREIATYLQNYATRNSHPA